MPRCLYCDEAFADTLRRCPHCGQAQDDQALARPAATEGALRSGGLGHVARRRRKRIWLALAVVGAGGLIGAVAIPSLDGADRLFETSEPERVLGSAHELDRTRLSPPDELTVGAAGASFGIETVRVRHDRVVVTGTCSPLAAVAVEVNGWPAVLSPRGDRFRAAVPLGGGPVEVVVRGIAGDEARLEAPLPFASDEPVDPGAARLVSHADGATVHREQVVLKVQPIDPQMPPRTEEARLGAVENVLLAGPREATLYRAPPGFVYLRTTERGQRAFLREADGAETVLVPGGVGYRGAGEGPPHGPRHVTLLRPFLIDRAEVTCRQYAGFLRHMRRTNDASLRHADDPAGAHRPLGWTGDAPPPGRADLPVTGVSWYGAYGYARWVGGRLPTEAEWERGAGGPLGLAFPWGDAFAPERCRAQAGGPLPSASLPEGESPFSLLHACGNVREWCDDRFDPRWYGRAMRTQPRGPSRGEHRAVRGGSFASDVAALRLTHRDHLDPSRGYADVGFRVVHPWTLGAFGEGK